MGQQEQCNDMAEPELPARHDRMAPGRLAPWLRRIAAGALALTIGLGQAYADELASGHEGGQGRDKSSAFAAAAAFAGDGAARASSTTKSEAFGTPRTKAQPRVEEAKVTVKIEEEGIGTEAWTRSVTRSYTKGGYVVSVTRSQSYATDEDGNRAIAKAFSKARAPSNAAAVRNGAGSVAAKTSVDVTGNGVASADAGGSIGVGRRGVKVETWGRTSAEVF